MHELVRGHYPSIWRLAQYVFPDRLPKDKGPDWVKDLELLETCDCGVWGLPQLLGLGPGCTVSSLPSAQLPRKGSGL